MRANFVLPFARSKQAFARHARPRYEMSARWTQSQISRAFAHLFLAANVDSELWMHSVVVVLRYRFVEENRVNEEGSKQVATKFHFLKRVQISHFILSRASVRVCSYLFPRWWNRISFRRRTKQFGKYWYGTGKIDFARNHRRQLQLLCLTLRNTASTTNDNPRPVTGVRHRGEWF